MGVAYKCRKCGKEYVEPLVFEGPVMECIAFIEKRTDEITEQCECNKKDERIKISVEIVKPQTCGECKFYSSTPYSCHNERGYQANCAMGYMKDHDTRDWNMKNRLFSGCRLGQ